KFSEKKGVLQSGKRNNRKIDLHSLVSRLSESDYQRIVTEGKMTVVALEGMLTMRTGVWMTFDLSLNISSNVLAQTGSFLVPTGRW
ncbi:MAG: hypothetical protein OEQ53_17410, partial [Saprospiraceae bacterium]|nr:hypothetical protein [Saprospiraceae bacterium]